ncbi:phosphopantetheine-binding protein [Streptomyces rugosispiralis]|uniref:Phosphopantetheine-binding protein n=1 Tax=Streptomyces rugosispiralis TaxID=2967341 RepID=A0ABT1UUW9_9ACTN|nr:phosphopantetheine-binding protein [Streptomyces rugosispiralis]MCQ8188161.1 phosphopantetheine-binding protein [Streptomyces rugosispiralis]
MDPLMASVAEAVRRRAETPPPATTDLDPDAELSSLGVSSLGVAGLIVDLEETLTFRFPDDAVTPEVFRTIRTLTDTVRTLCAPQAG